VASGLAVATGADGGNPDPPSTHGKHADQAKALKGLALPAPSARAGKFENPAKGPTDPNPK
jgi:hypothetical protein